MLDADEAREALCQASVRAYDSRRQRESRLAWGTYHADQAERHRRTLEGLIRYHEQEAQKLMTDGHEESA